jgi:hypothetical protein
MAYSINHNFTNHDDAQLEITVPYMVTADYAVSTNTANRCVLTNMTSPLGLPNTVEIQDQEIADVYKNSAIDRALWAPTRRGRAFYIRNTETWTQEDTTDPSAARWAFPMNCSIRCTVTNNDLVSESEVVLLVLRTLGKLYPGGLTAVAKILRGALNPKDN